MTINNQPVLTERFTEPGCRVTVFRAEENEQPTELALLRGGLGDIRSSSMGNIACEVLKASGGEVAVGIVRTSRPFLPNKVLRDAMNARETRAISMENAISGSLVRYPAISSLVVAGHSQGGVTVVDSMSRSLKNPETKDHLDGIAKGVFTMDTPGVFSQMEYEGSIVQGLGRLILNCSEDVVTMSNKERTRIVRDMTKRGMSPFEALHIIGEIAYLRDVDISLDIEELRKQFVEVWHSFRSGDVVRGAEVPSEFSRVYGGKHLRGIHGNGAKEVADDINNLFTQLHTYPIAA